MLRGADIQMFLSTFIVKIKKDRGKYHQNKFTVRHVEILVIVHENPAPSACMKYEYSNVSERLTIICMSSHQYMYRSTPALSLLLLSIIG
jgi:hypothetical protein